jgi:hypothetical protein
MNLGVPPPPDTIAPSIDFRLRKGWSYDARACEFAGPKGRRVQAEGLPEGSRIEFKAPSLQGGASAAEASLSRSMQLVLPRGARAEDYLDTVKKWPAVEAVSLPPRISLPNK